MLPVFLALVALHSAEALTCYDCLSISFPKCADSSMKNEFDKTPCDPDENYCAVMFMNDSEGKQVVSRQCASRPDEGEHLKSYIDGTQRKPLSLLRFAVCQGDLCNGDDLRANAANANANAAAPTAADAKKTTGRGGGSPGALPSALALALPLALAVTRRR